MHYKAFISYCHADQDLAAWLHRALESYRVPRRLVGTTGLHGTVTDRLRPIFRDREELSSSSDLSETIKQALVASDSLIVICSPTAVKSKWVNEEIRQFRSLGKGNRIYCVIVDGDPQASDPDRRCFPQALTEGEPDQAREPLAADIRKQADGKHLAKLKLAAGLLGVGLDELRQRDQQRKRKLQALTGLAVLAVAALLFFTWQSRLAEKEARLAREAQQVSAETMLTDFLEQAERLSDVADLDTRKAFGEVLSGYLAKIEPSDLTFESRRQLGVALSNRGVILMDEGQLEEAMEVFQNARQTLLLLVEESQGDAEALFELSQVEYWIGQVHLDWGQMEAAGESFRTYADVSIELNRLQPKNADWTMEVAYAQSNLGNLESRKIPSDPQIVLKYHQKALEFNEKAALLDKQYERDLAESHAYLADAWLGVCNLEQARINRQKNVELAAKYYRLDPSSNRLKLFYAYALVGLSRIHQDSGRLETAMTTMQQALQLQNELVEEDPNNSFKRWNLVRSSVFQVRFLEMAGREKESWDNSQAILAEIRELAEQDQDIRLDHAIVFGKFLRDLATHAYVRGDDALAERLMEESIDKLTAVASKRPDSLNALNELFLTYFHYWDHHQSELPDDSAETWLARISDVSNISSCAELDIASRQAVMAGDSEKARQYVSSLIGRGYEEAGFMRFCVKYELCPATR